MTFDEPTAILVFDMKSNKLHIFLTSLLLLILGGSIFFNILIFDKAKKYYLELNETRLDPFGLNYYPVNLKKLNLERQIPVVFFGDSRAEGWISPNISGYEFINRGIHGQTSVQTIQRFSSHLPYLQPNIVIIQVGVNDLKTIGLFPERSESIVTNCRENIKQIVEESKNLGAVVILTTIFPVGEVPLQRQPFWSDEIGGAVNEVNSYITTLAEDRVIILDAFSILADSQGMMPRKYGKDELHLNKQGYEILNLELVKLLNTITNENIVSPNLK
ncbi:MAG: SGNH/GDSL hydrolase family protein [Cyanobacteria bacterium P01_D01_bin.50]